MTSEVNRYNDILNAARKLMAQHGFEKTKIIDITNEVGVAKGTFYLYFNSKIELLVEIAIEIREKMINRSIEITNSNRPIKEQLKDILNVVFDVSEEYRDILPALHAVSVIDDERWKSEQAIKSLHFDFVSRLIKKGKENDEFRSDLEVNVNARLIVGMVEHAIQDIFIYNSEISIEEYKEAIYKAICAILY